MPETGEWLGRVLNGFYQYHAVPGNWASLDRFRERVSRYWRQVLERRSQRAPVDSGPGDSIIPTLAASTPAGASLSRGAV